MLHGTEGAISADAVGGIIAKASNENPAILTEVDTPQASECRAEFNLRWQVIHLTPDIMAPFGCREDVAWLLALAIPPDIQIDNLETAVLIEVRFNVLDNGAAVPAARDQLAGRSVGDRTRRQPAIRLVRTIARSGLPEAAPLLANLCRSLAKGATTDLPNPTGLIELSWLEAAVAGDIPTPYLDQLMARLNAS